MADTLSSNPNEGTVNMTDTLSSNPYEPIFTAQKAFFRTGATRTRKWRLDQLARMERMVSENVRIWNHNRRRVMSALAE